jgi:hypothetical protein
VAVEFVEVASQAELDKAVANGNIPICLEGFFRASGSASVRASDSASVEAYGSASVRASGSASVEAYDSASVEAYGSASVRASKYVAVQRHGTTPAVTGGVLIDIPPIESAQDFCDFYGLKPSRGAVVLFKLVDDSYVSGYGASYRPGEKTIAPDWDGGLNCCGSGLHFSPRPFMARRYSSGSRFVACRVRLADMVPITSHDGASDKCKAKACTVLFECDEDGIEIPAAVAA